jgi:hypothetical protein
MVVGVATANVALTESSPTLQPCLSARAGVGKL